MGGLGLEACDNFLQREGGVEGSRIMVRGGCVVKVCEEVFYSIGLWFVKGGGGVVASGVSEGVSERVPGLCSLGVCCGRGGGWGPDGVVSGKVGPNSSGEGAGFSA